MDSADEVVELIIGAALRAVWAFRLELVLVGGAGTLWLLAGQRVGEAGARAVLATLLILVVAIGPIRRVVGRLLRHARVRRQWARAVRSARISSLADRVPSVRRMRDIPAGQRFEVRVPVGSSVPDL